MNCRRARAYMEAYLMSDLDPKLAEQLERHLQTCHFCQAACEDLRRLIDLLQRAFEQKRRSA